MTITQTGLMQNADGSIYHLNVSPGDIADTVILVGDPNRTELVAQHFDETEVDKHKREFVVKTGRIGQQRLTVIGTGIGAGNIDIVLNEVDALVNVDFTTRTIKSEKKSLQFIRLGTCGSLKADIPVDSYILSTHALSFDGLLNYYHYQAHANEKKLLQSLTDYFSDFPMQDNIYVSEASSSLTSLFNENYHKGITLTCSGFYGPQHRRLRAPLIKEDIIEKAANFAFEDISLVNFEMETAAIYGLSRLFHHQACSISLVVANRFSKNVSKNPEKGVKRMINDALEKILQNII